MLSSGICELRERAGVADLDVLGVLRRRAHGDGDVVGHLVAGDRDHRRVADRAVGEHREVRGAAADVDQAHAQLLLIVGEHGEARCELLEHHVVDFEAAALNALLDVLRGAVGAGDDVHLRLEPHAGHADGIADAFLAVDQEFLRQHVQDLLVRGNRDGLGRVDHVLDVAVAHFLVADRDHAVRVQAAHVAAGDAGIHRMDLAARHQLGFFDRALDRLHGRLDIDHHAFLQAARRVRAQAQHFDRAVGRDLAHQRDDLGRADIQPHDQSTVGTLRHFDARPLSCRGARQCRASRSQNRWCSACRRTRCRPRAARRA